MTFLRPTSSLRTTGSPDPTVRRSRVTGQRDEQLAPVGRPGVLDDAVVLGGALAFAPRLFLVRELLVAAQALGVDEQPRRGAQTELDLPQVELEPVGVAAAQERDAVTQRRHLDAARLRPAERRIAEQPLDSKSAAIGRRHAVNSRQARAAMRGVSVVIVLAPFAIGFVGIDAGGSMPPAGVRARKARGEAGDPLGRGGLAGERGCSRSRTCWR